jgi:hypothetical protein
MSLETAPDNMPPTTQIDTPALPPPQMGGDSTDSQELTPDQRRAAALLIVAAIVVILLVIASVVFLLNQPSLKVAQIRDVFIIFMAIQSLLSGLALVVLLVQLARLINLLQNEIKPILDTTNETINSLRGTTVFLSDNLVEPVIKLNEYLAGLSQLLMFIGIMKRTTKKGNSKGE